MRAALIVLSFVAALLSLSFALFPRQASEADQGPHPALPGPPPVPRWESKYDSVRTDLSDYLWPTDAGRGITSTFGEFRRSHFHAGIDVSTGDHTGYKVFDTLICIDGSWLTN